jgi:hypothetical protein
MDDLGPSQEWVAGVPATQVSHLSAQIHDLYAADMADLGVDERVALLVCLLHTGRIRARDDLAEMLCNVPGVAMSVPSAFWTRMSSAWHPSYPVTCWQFAWAPARHRGQVTSLVRNPPTRSGRIGSAIGGGAALAAVLDDEPVADERTEGFSGGGAGEVEVLS